MSYHDLILWKCIFGKEEDNINRKDIVKINTSGDVNTNVIAHNKEKHQVFSKRI